MRVLALILITIATVLADDKWSWGEEGKNSPEKVVFTESKKREVTENIRISSPTQKGDFNRENIRFSSPTQKEDFNRESIRFSSPTQKEDFNRDNIRNSSPTQKEDFQGENITGRQARKIVAGESGKGDGKSEGRFSSIKRSLCKYGIGVNCKPSGYDLLEIQQPYDASSYPVSYGGVDPYANGAPYASADPYGGAGYASPSINPQHVLAVQPVALQPVGSPIQAVPLGPGGHSVGGGYGGPGIGGGGYNGVGIGGGYESVGIGSGGFGGVYNTPSFPSAGYGIPAIGPPAYATPYSPPSHKSQYPTSDFVSQVSYEADYSQEEPIQTIKKKEVHIEPQVVKHYHTHTHIHKGSDVGSSLYTSGVSSFNRPARSHTLPVVPPSSSAFNSFYREDCECVPNYFCSSSDVVGRSNELPLLDARNRPTDILSTAPDNDEQFAASEKKEIVVEPPKVSEKTKREIRTTFKVFNSSQPVQGRQAHGTPRIRNIKNNQQCSRGEVCCRNPGFTGRALSYTCGKKNKAGVLGRVRNAKLQKQLGDTEFGEYPWQAAILKRESSEVVYVCGAALVNDKHIITAAHCVNGMGPNELKIRLGEWDVNRKTEFYDYMETDVQKIIVHPKFYSGTLTNDVAILVLEDVVDFSKNPHINPVCLPHLHSDFMNRHCHVTGWGKDAFGNDGDFQFILKEVEVPVWGNKGCETALRKTRLGASYKLDDGMLCAGGEEGKDACKGDGGGPLVCTGQDGSMELAGIVSWGIGCGESGIPGVYVNIPYYMEWITETLQTVR